MNVLLEDYRQFHEDIPQGTDTLGDPIDVRIETSNERIELVFSSEDKPDRSLWIENQKGQLVIVVSSDEGDPDCILEFLEDGGTDVQANVGTDTARFTN